MKCQSKSWDVWLTFREKLRPPRCAAQPGTATVRYSSVCVLVWLPPSSMRAATTLFLGARSASKSVASMLNAVTKGALAMDLLSREWSSGNRRVSAAMLACRRYCPAVNTAVRTDNGHARYLRETVYVAARQIFTGWAAKFSMDDRQAKRSVRGGGWHKTHETRAESREQTVFKLWNFIPRSENFDSRYEVQLSVRLIVILFISNQNKISTKELNKSLDNKTAN